MAPEILLDQYLIINAVPLATPAFFLANHDALKEEAPLLGEDTQVPGAAGRLPNPRWRDERTLTFPLWVRGRQDLEGAVITDPRQGLINNVKYLKDNLGIASDVGDGTVVAIWHQYDGTELTANVHPALKGGNQDGQDVVLLTTLDITIPAGAGFA